MAGITDIVGLLEKIPLWRKLTELPERVQTLEQRVAALERRPHLPICKSCGIGQVKLVREQAPKGPFDVFAGAGKKIQIFQCSECGFETTKSN